MKYLKITAENYTEAMKKLRKEHGDEAIPISHKYIKQGGLFNSKFFGKEVVELTAAVKDMSKGVSSNFNKPGIDITVDDKSSFGRESSLSRVQEIIERAASTSTSSEFKTPPLSESSFNREVKNTFEQSSLGVREAVEVEEKTENISDEAYQGIAKEVSEIKTALNKLMSESEESSDSTVEKEDLGALSSCREILLDNDFEPEDCEMIIRKVRKAVSPEELKDKFTIEKNLKDLLKSRIVTTGPIGKGTGQKIMMFVGPTGVGKTTTLAKLGAIHSLREGAKVSFITIDTYRIAATEQLKKYAEIMRIPIHVVSDQREFKEVVSQEKADLILVDTSGRSHRNDLKISEIKSFADSIDYDLEKVLCVSANTKKRDLKSIFSAFDIMHFDSVIITKVDESSFLGNVVNVADKYNKPISYYTDGQEVPNNIHVADPEGIVSMMMGDFAE